MSVPSHEDLHAVVMEVAGAKILRRAPAGHVAVLQGKVVADSARPDTLADVARAAASAGAPPSELAQLALWWWPGGQPPGALVEGAFPTSPRGFVGPLPDDPDPQVRSSQDGLQISFFAFEPHALRLHRADVRIDGGEVAFVAEELTEP